MSALAHAAADYLRLRNRLGHELAEYHRLLPRFVVFLEDAGQETVTVAAALAWVNAPDVDPLSTVASHRMTIARGFARHMAGLDRAPRSRRSGWSVRIDTVTSRSSSAPMTSTR